MENLPVDLITLVLRHVPLSRSKISLQAVCTKWRDAMAVPEAHWEPSTIDMPHGHKHVYSQVSLQLLSLLPWGYSKRKLQAQGICWIRYLSTDAIAFENWPAVFENATEVQVCSPSEATHITPQRFPVVQKLCLRWYEDEDDGTWQATEGWPAVLESVTTVIVCGPDAVPCITPQRFPGLQKLQMHCCFCGRHKYHQVVLQGFHALKHLTLASRRESLARTCDIPDACGVEGCLSASLQAFVEEFKGKGLHNVSTLDIGFRSCEPGAVLVQAFAVSARLVKIRLAVSALTKKYKDNSYNYLLCGFDIADKSDKSDYERYPYGMQFIIDTEGVDGRLDMFPLSSCVSDNFPETAVVVMV